jgi:streptogramin lyase
VHLVPNSLLQIRASTRRIVSDSRIPTPGGSQPAPVPPREIWTLSPFSQVISITDASHQPPGITTTAGFGFASTQTGFAIAYLDGLVWVTGPRSVVSMDPTTRQVRGRPIPLPGGPTLLAAGLGAVWVLTNRDQLYSIDPENRRLRLVAQLPAGTNGIAAGENAVWVSNYPEELLSRIDPGDGHPRRTHVGVGPAGVGIADGYIWVSNTGMLQTVSQIDPSTGRVVHTIHVCTATVSNGDASDVEPDAYGDLWVTCPSSHAIAEILPTTHRVRKIRVGSLVFPVDLTVAYGSVWVTLQEGP